MSVWTCVSRNHGSCGDLHSRLSQAARCCLEFELSSAERGETATRLPYEKVNGRWEPVKLTTWQNIAQTIKNMVIAETTHHEHDEFVDVEIIETNEYRGDYSPHRVWMIQEEDPEMLALPPPDPNYGSIV